MVPPDPCDLRHMKEPIANSGKPEPEIEVLPGVMPVRMMATRRQESTDRVKRRLPQKHRDREDMRLIYVELPSTKRRKRISATLHPEPRPDHICRRVRLRLAQHIQMIREQVVVIIQEGNPLSICHSHSPVPDYRRTLSVCVMLHNDSLGWMGLLLH